MFEALHADGLEVGVLSNTIWPADRHRGFFERDGVRHLVDGDVYTNEIPWTTPSPHAFLAAVQAVGATDPARCVQHSTIPADQRGHIEGGPDAVVTSLAEIPAVLAAWS